MDGNTQIATAAPASLPATQAGTDPFSSYGAKVGQQGTFLTFKNGEFMHGQDGKEIPLGTKLAANVAGLRLGWKRWFAGAVTDDFLELLIDQRPIAARNTLGDADSSLWEIDTTTKQPRDPWQLTNELTLVDNEGETFIYATSSKGGIGAIGRLCKEYGKAYRQRPGQVPIIELATGYYMHKEYGKTYFPEFNIVDWVDENEVGSGAEAEAEEDAASAPAAPPPPATATRKARF